MNPTGNGQDSPATTSATRTVERAAACVAGAATAAPLPHSQSAAAWASDSTGAAARGCGVPSAILMELQSDRNSPPEAQQRHKRPRVEQQRNQRLPAMDGTAGADEAADDGAVHGVGWYCNAYLPVGDWGLGGGVELCCDERQAPSEDAAGPMRTAPQRLPASPRGFRLAGSQLPPPRASAPTYHPNPQVAAAPPAAATQPLPTAGAAAPAAASGSVVADAVAQRAASRLGPSGLQTPHGNFQQVRLQFPGTLFSCELC